MGFDGISLGGWCNQPPPIDQITLSLGKTLGAVTLSAAATVEGAAPFVYTGSAGQIYLVNESGVPTWTANHPAQWNGYYYEFENGGNGRTGQGQNCWTNLPAGTGAARTYLTGQPGWFQNAGQIETGTATNGSYALGSATTAAICFTSSSGQWTYEATVCIPTASDATDSFVTYHGFSDNSNANLTVDGAYVRYQHSVNAGQFELVAASNSTRVSASLGVTMVAGNTYHIRVLVRNNESVSAWAKLVCSGSSWADDGVWGAPHATVTSSIPSGDARATGCGMAILKTAGTGSRQMRFGYHRMERIPLVTTGSVGDRSTMLAVDENGDVAWLGPNRIAHPIVFYAYGRGGFNPSPSISGDFGPTTAGGGSIASVAVDNGWLGTTGMNTGGTTATGSAAYHTSPSLTLDDYVQPMVLEMLFNIPTLSTVSQEMKFNWGLQGDLTGDPIDGVWTEINSAQNANILCKAAISGSTTVSVDSGITAVAGTSYIARIILTSTRADFYVKADGAASFGSPVASITGSLPVGKTMHAAAVLKKYVGTTSRSVRFGYAMAFQRSTT